MPGDVPIFKQQLDKTYEMLSFVRININYNIDILFHVGANVPYLAHRIDRLKSVRLYSGRRLPTRNELL